MQKGVQSVSHAIETNWGGSQQRDAHATNAQNQHSWRSDINQKLTSVQLKGEEVCLAALSFPKVLRKPLSPLGPSRKLRKSSRVGCSWTSILSRVGNNTEREARTLAAFL